jgi:hypothetical protein
MTAWLRCRLNRGMFSDEVVVTYPAASHLEHQRSAFVPRSYVRSETEHQGEVLVKVIAVSGGRYAVLPNSECDIVWPEDADLKPL